MILADSIGFWSTNHPELICKGWGCPTNPPTGSNPPPPSEYTIVTDWDEAIVLTEDGISVIPDI